jgi:serine/threonine-protein kinase
MPTPTFNANGTDTIVLQSPAPDAADATAAPDAADVSPDGEITAFWEKFFVHLDDAAPMIAYDATSDAALTTARYIVRGDIGRGSVGQVVLAEDTHLQRSVALKFLRDDAGLTRERLTRFLIEAQLTAQLTHPMIPPVYEIGRLPGGMPYFTMKLVRGKSLQEILNYLRVLPAPRRQATPYSRHFLLRRFVQLANGIAYAHHRGVSHRDLKPANIMLGDFGETQIMDWGLAKVLAASPLANKFPPLSAHTAAVRIIGTPSYMSPEQAAGKADGLTPTSDIFAFGLLLAEALTLRRVFTAVDYESVAALLKKVIGAGPIELEVLAPTEKFPADLAAIVRRCTQPQPEKRYLEAEEIVTALRLYLETQA